MGLRLSYLRSRNCRISLRTGPRAWIPAMLLPGPIPAIPSGLSPNHRSPRHSGGLPLQSLDAAGNPALLAGARPSVPAPERQGRCPAFSAGPRRTQREWPSQELLTSALYSFIHIGSSEVRHRNAVPFLRPGAAADWAHQPPCLLRARTPTVTRTGSMERRPDESAGSREDQPAVASGPRDSASVRPGRSFRSLPTRQRHPQAEVPAVRPRMKATARRPTRQRPRTR